MRQIKVYLGGALNGFTKEQIEHNRNIIKRFFAHKFPQVEFIWLDPAIKFLAGEPKKAMFQTDAMMILQSDIVILDFSLSTESKGTIWEVGYTYALQIHKPEYSALLAVVAPGSLYGHPMAYYSPDVVEQDLITTLQVVEVRLGQYLASGLWYSKAP